MPSHKRGSGRGFTLVELLIVVAILGVLMGLVFPAIMEGRRKALRAACANNLKELHAMALMYASDEKIFPFAGTMMTSATASDHLQLLIESFNPKNKPKSKLFVCPASKEVAAEQDPNNFAYSLADRNLSYAWIDEDATPDSGANKMLSADKSLDNHGGDGINVVYFGADVEWIKAKEGVTWEQITGNQLTR